MQKLVMAVRWALVTALCALASQGSANVQPGPFASYHALTSEAISASRPKRSLENIRIINGDDAKPGQFPHQVGMFVDMSTFCGGALIHPKWILTSATCVAPQYGSRYTAFLGAQYMIMPAETNRIAVTTTWAYPHEEFEAETFKNDVALLLLPREVKTNYYINTINLPPKSYASQTFDGSSFQLSGWGYQSDGAAAISPSLKYINLKGVSNATCIETYSYEIYTDNIMCCVGSNKQSPCQGDTGGALVQKESNGSFTHIATASFTPSKGCSNGLPSGFTKTASYLDWISAKTGISIKL